MNHLITILFLGITTITMQAKTDKEQMEIKVNGNHATLTGRSRVTATSYLASATHVPVS